MQPINDTLFVGDADRVGSIKPKINSTQIALKDFNNKIINLLICESFLP